VKRVSQYAALLAYVVFLAFPLLWLLSTSLKTPQEMALTEPTWIPREPTLANFSAAFGEQDLVGAALRSLVVALFASVLTVLISLPASYAMARYRGLVNKIAIGWVLVSQVFPFILIIIPLFMILRDLELVNTLPGLVLVHVTFTLPFALWMLQGYVRAVPPELEEAAAVDGASRVRAIATVVAPLLAPGVVATLLFSFISSWNEFMFALVILQDPDVIVSFGSTEAYGRDLKLMPPGWSLDVVRQIVATGEYEITYQNGFNVVLRKVEPTGLPGAPR